jgi:hypothetical protein
MKHYLIVSPIVQLEMLQVAANLMGVIVFFEDGEREDKDRMLRIDRGQAVIPTLVHKDEVIAKIGGSGVHYAAF